MLTYNVFLIGFMGTGKSTIASMFSRKNAMELVEMDETIVKRQGMSISDIFAQLGEEYFRNLETSLLKEISVLNNHIVSCGGGATLRKENVSIMKENGKIVLLTAAPETVYQRLKDDNTRPLLEGRKNVEMIKALMEERRERYEAAADIIIHTDGKSAEEICDEITGELKRAKERYENV